LFAHAASLFVQSYLSFFPTLVGFVLLPHVTIAKGRIARKGLAKTASLFITTDIFIRRSVFCVALVARLTLRGAETVTGLP